MQNIPGIATETASEAVQLVKLATSTKTRTAQTALADAKDDKRALFAELFSEHTDMVEDELSMAPMAHKEKMLDSVPGIKEEEDEEKPASAAGTKAPKVTPEVEEKTEEKNLESRMTGEDLDAVRDDLKEYGMSDEEIAAIETQVDSEEGMTWGQFVSTIAKKMAEARKTEMSDDQKASLASFFTKLGFTEKESDKLIGQLQNGRTDKVLQQVEAKIAAMPEDQQTLFSKDEVEAFVSALGLSKEFVTQAQELFAGNTLPKDMKQAFTQIRQELAGLDRKDQKLVKAVGKAFAATMGDTQKQSSAALQVEEAVDLTPRVAEEQADTDVREELAQAFRDRKDAASDNTVRRQASRSAADKVEIKSETPVQDQTLNKDLDPEAEHDRKWNNFVDRVREDGTGRTETATSAKTAATEAKAGEAKTALAQQTAASASTAKGKAWENVSAPKVLKQVDQAVLKTLQNGAKQLTLQLTPENLGKLSVVLSVQGKEVSATIRTENSDAHKIITDNLQIIKNSLESQGLKVDKLDVQAGLADNQNYGNWFGESQHNLSREREAMVAMRNHMRSMRAQNGGGVARDVQSVGERVITSDQGLHLIA
ncbi:Flagellar hook-length control protein-like, C-terminal domain-containing protein [Pseudodesulfovibrio mercurii]|uniref:Flagellar hook-length control protein-like, C-terminal domain-containing protein n=1 Tax=Pseudodesulfovibrio mercurii TaxID=641491 RepID=F0JJ59_9BACT|nr:flagellar hook-length control protein FliK [Pseudodesulfovibrio mercurii]EGB15958.1 Flagellar hook-length control protein-like, C-terminal domain-containing protein [Pseudodesulfovibrio mercurii]